MTQRLRIAFVIHSIRSDWNNGNAHFLRGLMRAMISLGHDVVSIEQENNWSITNLRMEGAQGEEAIANYQHEFSEIQVLTYGDSVVELEAILHTMDVVVMHEWNSCDTARALLKIRDAAGYVLLFHDTHHRASSSPVQIEGFDLPRFDGVLAFSESLRRTYRERFYIERCWTFHEAADDSVFRPLSRHHESDVVWIGNWGDGERAQQIEEFLIGPARELPDASYAIYGVRYPKAALAILDEYHISYGGYVENLAVPKYFAASALTIHIPRQEYVNRLPGVPTIRMFEALSCGIPLICAPWRDEEELFHPGSYVAVRNGEEARVAIKRLLRDEELRHRYISAGLACIKERHTCMHRAQQLADICVEAME